ncbi:MAG: hypothetical protein JNK81_13580 [Anaerolineales bacterium]|nr:hypothetical protein [Anaerolineales bacterium]
MNSANQFSDAKSFRYSLDWRFFLPISEKSRMLYIGESGEEIQAFFQRLNINYVSYLENDIVDKIRSLSASSSTFDIVSIPYTVFSHSTYPEVKKILRPGGSLLLGFSNLYRSKNENAISLIKLKSLLMKAGFSQIKYYGVFPDQYAPEYIFPLKLQATKFALRHRYQYRMKSWLLQTLSFSVFLFALSYFLPAYYVVVKNDNV